MEVYILKVFLNVNSIPKSAKISCPLSGEYGILPIGFTGYFSVCFQVIFYCSVLL